MYAHHRKIFLHVSCLLFKALTFTLKYLVQRMQISKLIMGSTDDIKEQIKVIGSGEVCVWGQVPSYCMRMVPSSVQ